MARCSKGKDKGKDKGKGKAKGKDGYPLDFDMFKGKGPAPGKGKLSGNLAADVSSEDEGKGKGSGKSKSSSKGNTDDEDDEPTGEITFERSHDDILAAASAAGIRSIKVVGRRHLTQRQRKRRRDERAALHTSGQASDAVGPPTSEEEVEIEVPAPSVNLDAASGPQQPANEVEVESSTDEDILKAREVTYKVLKKRAK